MLVGRGAEFKLDNKMATSTVGHKKILCSENLEHLSNSLIGWFKVAIIILIEFQLAEKVCFSHFHSYVQHSDIFRPYSGLSLMDM